MNQAAIGVLLLSVASFANVLFGQSGTSEMLKLETTIPMADVQGRIDHLDRPEGSAPVCGAPGGAIHLR